MIGKVRKQMKKLGVVMTFLALLFVSAGPLGQIACAAEGCGEACIEQAAGAAVDELAPSSGDCVDCDCACAIAHCGQVASLPSKLETILVQKAARQHAPMNAVQLTSASVDGLERPPRG